MKKKLFTLFVFSLFLAMSNTWGQNTVSIGTANDLSGNENWPASGTTPVSMAIDGDTGYEFLIEGNNKTDAQTVCNTSKVLHYVLGSNSHYLKGTVKSTDVFITSLSINGSTNKKAADNQPGSVDITFYNVDGDAIGEVVNVLFPASDVAWEENKNVTVPAGAHSFNIARPAANIRLSYLEYTLESAGPSSDATIKSLTVAGNVVEPVESANSYELPASFDGTTAEVVITPNDAKSVVTVDSDSAPNTEAGAYTTNVTIGTPVTITVTPETGAEDALTYTLSVTKAANLSSDTSLKSVTVDDVELPAGDDGNYTLDIAFAYDKPLDIVVAANDDMADAVIDQNKPTVEGGASVDVKITVTAEDQSTKNYTLKITRAAASVECELTTFSINGFIGTIDEDAKTIGIKVIKDYDFSHTPVMTVSENATAVWNKDAKSVVVTAQDGTTNATYTVNVATESVEALSVFPTNLSFAAATYTEPVEWIYGASYNAELKDAADTNVVGGYELKKENDNVGIEAGSNVLNIYLEKCATLTVNVGATGGRYVVATVGDTECGNATLTKGVASDLVCTVDKREPVTVVIRSYKNDKKEAATGGTRIYSVNVTAPTDQPDNISNQSVENAMTVYSVDGIVYVSVAKAQVANIYGIDGRLVKVVELNEGDNTISGLSNGIYLVNNKKVVIK